jgi:hypothetical protein
MTQRDTNTIPADARTEAVLSLLSGTRTAEQLAADLHVGAAEVEIWRELYLDAARRHGTGADAVNRRSNRPLALAVGLLSLVGIVALGGPVVAEYAGGCVDDVDGNSLFCFHENSPAMASQVNYNFSKVVDWVEEKVGPCRTNDVTLSGTISGDGSDNLNLKAGTDIRGGDLIQGDSGLRLRGQEGNSNDIRILTNGTVRIPTLESTGDMLIDGNLTITNGLPITVENVVNQDFGMDSPSVELGDNDGHRACFLSRVKFTVHDSGLLIVHTDLCRVYRNGGKWMMKGSVAHPSDVVNCSAYCVAW